ncbi:unnamed protein product [Rangifer tarandus platyrhynchus]|uniref:Uncharacterized protein n=1 Tax=Rangifer tarandus platyrhynchus TaxID=3082113 RepID=A0AC59ZX99_RANTA
MEGPCLTVCMCVSFNIFLKQVERGNTVAQQCSPYKTSTWSSGPVPPPKNTSKYRAILETALYTVTSGERDRILSSAASNPLVLDPRFPHFKSGNVSMCQSLSSYFSRWSQGASSRGMSPPESPRS